jgi:hypothetical protein
MPEHAPMAWHTRCRIHGRSWPPDGVEAQADKRTAGLSASQPRALVCPVKPGGGEDHLVVNILGQGREPSSNARTEGGVSPARRQYVSKSSRVMRD